MTETDEKLPTELLKEIHVNGIDGTTGDYSLPPMSSAAWAGVIKGESGPKDMTDFEDKKHRAVDSPVAETVTDQLDLAQMGWAVVFPAEMEEKRREAIKEALSPLLQHRQEKAGDLYRIFEGESGYRSKGEQGRPESKRDFCKRQSPEIKRGPARPEQMPFYVLLVGSPEEIPFEFQFQLDVMRGVGRLDFGNDLEGYARYAQSVVAAETGAVKLPRKAAFFSVRNPGDDATLISDRYLARPLLANLQQPKLQGEIPLKFAWDFGLAPSGEKKELARLLSGKDQTPALLFTASHGMVFPSAQKQQFSEQGALLCQHWVKDAPVSRDDYFAAEELDDANLLGLVAMFFACFGVGTPRFDYFTPPNATEKTKIAPHSFISALPNRMLRQGALAVIGHVDRAWGHSFISPGSNVEIEAFVTAMRKLLNGDPVGLATDPSFNLKYADMTTTLSETLQKLQWNPTYLDDEELVRLWTANNDTRSYAVLGDPAARIPFVQKGAAGKRPATPAVLPKDVADRLVTLQADIGPTPDIDYTAEAKVTPQGDVKVEAEHLQAVDQDFAIQINQITKSLQEFGDKIAKAVSEAAEKILTLEVRTYTADNLNVITPKNTGNAELRALTHVDFDGDMRVFVPSTGAEVDTELWEIHREMVREAQTNRAAFLAAMAKLASDLLGMIKIK
jgi:hypothetical protein